MPRKQSHHSSGHTRSKTIKNSFLQITYAQKIEEKTGHEVRLFANFGEQTLPNNWEKFVLSKECFRRSLRTMLFVANPTKEESKIKGKTI